MRGGVWRAAVVGLLAATVSLAGATSADSAPSDGKYASCQQLWADYPNGLTVLKSFQRAAERWGQLVPDIDAKVYFKNNRTPSLRGTFPSDGVLCEVADPRYSLEGCTEVVKKFPGGLAGRPFAVSEAVAMGYSRPVLDARWYGANVSKSSLWGLDRKREVLCESIDPLYVFGDCEALQAIYPGGVARDEPIAEEWENRGFIRPTVSDVVYGLYSGTKKFWGDDADRDVLCEKSRPGIPPAPVVGLRLGSFSPSGGSMCQVLVEWKDDTQAFPEALYDVYVNGTLVSEGERLWFDSVVVEPGKLFNIDVVAFNSAGRSDPVRISGQAPVVQICQGLKRVVYTISGTASSVDVTLENDSGGTEQHTDLVNPVFAFWMKPGAFVYIAAYNNGQSGTVTCTIMSNDRRVATSTSSGAYVGATCSGTA